jgi:hypothetical protein
MELHSPLEPSNCHNTAEKIQTSINITGVVKDKSGDVVLHATVNGSLLSRIAAAFSSATDRERVFAETVSLLPSLRE